MLWVHLSSNLNLTPWPRAIELTWVYVMSQLSKLHHSRDQWKHKATQRGERERYQRKQSARFKAERDRVTTALKATQARLRQVEAQLHGLATVPKVDVVHVALQLFCVARIGFRAVSRVLTLLALALGIHKVPCPQTIINWVIRLTIVRLDAARTLRSFPLSQSPFTNGLIWMIDISIGLGTGKILAVLAVDAHHHHLASGALPLLRAHGIGVCVADSWTGEAIAEVLKRLIAQMGRPAAYLKDGGSDLHKAVALLEEQRLDSPCLDDISHATAGMLKRSYHSHPAFESFVSACGRVSGKLKHTLLACLVPPTVRTKARFMNVHRLFTWAERVLKLSPPGGAKRGSIVAKLRASLDNLPACKALITRFQGDAGALLACQRILKTHGLSHATLTQCQPLIDTMPSATLRLEFRAYLSYQLETATALGLDHIGLPISSDAIESLFAVAKQHGVGETQDADRIALRLPAFCGIPTREEAQQVLEVSVARQHEFTSRLTSLTKQRREVLSHPERLVSLGLKPGQSHVELLPSPKNRSNDETIVTRSISYEKYNRPRFAALDEPLSIESTGPPDIRMTALTS